MGEISVEPFHKQKTAAKKEANNIKIKEKMIGVFFRKFDDNLLALFLLK